MSVSRTIRRVIDTQPVEIRRLHGEHINPTFIRALELLGPGRDFTRAEGMHLWDGEGKKYWDFLAGYGATSVGHNHPDVIAAIAEVLKAEIPHFLLISPQPLAAELARQLAARAPGDLDVCYLSNSGSEAVEGALKLARAATARSRFVSAEGSYHGTTLGALSITGSNRHRAPFDPLLAGCVSVGFGDLAAIERELRRRDVAAVVLEPLQGEGGVRPAPSGWLAAVSQLCQKYGTLLVLDEVQTGLGRCGQLFACEQAGVEPDILLLGKGLSGGMIPIAASITRKRIWQKAYGTLERYDLHCSTFSGGPVACAAALATLSIIDREGLVANAADLGPYLDERLRAVTASHSLVRDVRGRGLFWGIELAAPAGVAADLLGQWVVLGMLERGIVTQVCAEAPHVVRVQPPLTVTREAIDCFVHALQTTLEQHATGVVGSLVGAAGRAAKQAFARFAQARKPDATASLD